MLLRLANNDYILKTAEKYQPILKSCIYKGKRKSGLSKKKWNGFKILFLSDFISYINVYFFLLLIKVD